MNKKGLILLVLILFVGAFAYGQGCSQCRLMSEQASAADENSFGSNINYGILYLMIIPYLLIMFLLRKQIATLFKRLVKR